MRINRNYLLIFFLGGIVVSLCVFAVAGYKWRADHVVLEAWRGQDNGAAAGENLPAGPGGPLLTDKDVVGPRESGDKGSHPRPSQNGLTSGEDLPARTPGKTSAGEAPSTAWSAYVQPISLVGSAITFLLSTLGTISTLMFSWLQEKRQSQEFRLKIMEMQVQLAREAQVSTSSNSSPV